MHHHHPDNDSYVLVNLDSPIVFVYFLIAAIVETVEQWIRSWAR